MARIRVSDITAPWRMGHDTVSPELAGELSKGELEGETRIQHPGSETQLQAFEVRVGPDTTVAVHAHQLDEIIYVVSGQLILGSRVVEPGQSVYVDGMTLYGFKSGPEGLHFVNFRARQDLTYYTKAQYQEMRSQQRGESTPAAHINAI